MRILRVGYSVLLSLLLWLWLGGLTGCAPAVSRQFRERVPRPVPFKALLEDTEAYEGKRVILGGYVLETVNQPDGSLLIVLQAPLDSRNKPKSRDLSEGRFLMETERFLDPEIYSKDRKLTVGGKVSGVRSQLLGKRLYGYPIIEAEELYLWPKEAPYIRPDPDYYWGHPWSYYPYGPYPWWAW